MKLDDDEDFSCDIRYNKLYRTRRLGNLSISPKLQYTLGTQLNVLFNILCTFVAIPDQIYQTFSVCQEPKPI